MNLRRLALILVPYLWLMGFFLVPFLIVVKIALSDTAIAIPPYWPVLDISAGWTGFKEFFSELDFENFTFLTTDDEDKEGEYEVGQGAAMPLGMGQLPEAGGIAPGSQVVDDDHGADGQAAKYIQGYQAPGNIKLHAESPRSEKVGA